MNIIISAILMMTAFWVGVKFDEDKDRSIEAGKPVRTWTAWLSVALFIACFLTFWLGSK